MTSSGHQQDAGVALWRHGDRTAAGAQTPRTQKVFPSPSSPNSIRSPDPPSYWAATQSISTTSGQPRLLHLESITSPPDSEAYYGETDSDADIQASPGHLQSAQQQPNQPQVAPEKHRRARKKSPRSPPGSSGKTENEQQSLSEMSGYESGPGGAAEGVLQSTSGVAKREIVYQPDASRAETPFSDVEGFLPTEEPEKISNVTSPSPESMLLPHATKSIRAERHLIPMIGPVEHPVDEDLTTTYLDKAKEAKLNRSESAQDKNVKEARTKCRTIASLLTDAPNPHSKGVLMFKKRRQRAKKYTLVSYGSVDEDRYIEDEDGVLPTSESEFDEEGFSDARSLTNNSDWDSTYMDIEKSKMEHETQEEKGLTDVSGKGAALFELQRQKSEQAAESAPLQNPQEHHKTPVAPPRKSVANGNVTQMVNYDKSQETRSSESTKVTSTQISLTPAYSNDPQAPGSGNAIFNRSARPFTPGQVGQRAMASSVSFKPSTPKIIENFPVQNVASSAFTPFTADSPANPQKTPVSSVASLFIPAPGRTVSPAPQYHENHKENHLAPTTPRTTTASIYLSSPSRPSGPHTVTSQSNISQSNPVSPSTSTVSQFISPAPITSSYISPVTQVNQSPECVNSREQRISVPIGRTGILNEARKRGGRKQMFVKKEEKKIMPNPELLSMVKNIDEKPKQEQHVAGFESGPEEDFLSLGAEACNFMQSSARKLKVPPPVAPKPNFKTTAEQLVNGSSDLPQLKGKGAELFAKRQSRMDKFVVDSDHRSSSRPNSRPRTPSPTPSLPSSWKYSSNIRAPPPIGYNPLVSPFCPLAASKTQGGKADSKVKKGTPGKPRMQAIDFMRHKPYQLNSAMFCFGDSSNSPDTPKMSSTLSRQVPVKTRAHEIKRFSTPTPMSSVNMTPTVLTPRSATTLAEPVWRSDVSCQPMPTKVPGPAPFYASVQETPQRNMESSVISPTNSFTSPRSVSTIQVPKPRFSAAKTGMQANVWRPAKVHF
ncbi:synaptopodin 2-like protein isoform X2 [Dendropsophus ebraccatus]|uniref:synaptopodin 2-like protein isoform X2 n=1 Tax=Dendropsophus ebraccatus TaxID=150705 RepID=UPI0038321160